MTEKELKTCACVEDNCNCKEIAESELRRKLDLLLRTGSILMESAADTSRIMRTMKRAAAFLGLDERYMHLYINWNVLMVNYSDEEHSFSKFQRCEKHGINLTSISQVSKLTWKAIKDNYSLEQYEQALNDIKATPRSFTPWQVAIGGGFACGGFCIQFGCDWPAFFFCSLAAILGFRLRMFLPTKGCNNYVAIGISAFVATLIAWLTSFLSLNPSIAEALPAFMHSDTPWHPLMACALFIVPGVPLINFVSDMLDGYIEVGMVRALNTLLMLFAMAFGIAFAIQICHIDNFVKDLTMTPHHEYWEFAIAAAVSVKEALTNLAMQIAALNPKYVSRDEISEEYISHEKEILLAQIMNDPKESQKPEKVINGMIEGRVSKELKEICLVDQVYVKAEDGKQTVAKYLDEVSKAVGTPVSVKRFVRFETGEGIEKKQEDFAAEVAAQMGN